jgi:integrase
MSEGESPRDLSGLVVARVGRLTATGHTSEPYILQGSDDERVESVEVFFRELIASGRSVATVRSYGMDLLRWWRFLHAVDVAWDRASRVDARDFSCWIQLTAKARQGSVVPASAESAATAAAAANPVTGKPALGTGYSPATVAHSETVLRSFYDFHRDAGTGPLLNPFPLDLSRRSRRAHAHHNPMDHWAPERVGRYRPRVSQRIPRAIPEDLFDKLFAALSSDRDRALVAFWISSGVRASELLGVRECDVDPGQQLITVGRGATRTDATVVVDTAKASPPVELPCGASDVRACERHSRFGLDSARLTSQCSEADGQRPALVLGGGQRGAGARAFVDDRNLSDTR